MFPIKNKKFPTRAPVTMRMMGLPGTSPMTTIGLHAMTMERETMNYALTSTGYLTLNSAVVDPFIRYEALLMMLHKYYSAGQRIDAEVDSAFLRAAAEMTATWRYKYPASQSEVAMSRKWVHEVTRHIKMNPIEIKNIWGQLFDRFAQSLSEPPIVRDDSIDWWTSRYYIEFDEVPSYCLQLWMSKTLLPHMSSIDPSVQTLNQLMLNPKAETTLISEQIRHTAETIRAKTDLQLQDWYDRLSPAERISWWELQAVACSTDGAKLHNSAIFVAVSAMGKTGSVTANWVANRRTRWGSKVQKTIEDDMFTGPVAIKEYFERNHPLESEIEGAYQFLASTYFAAKTLNNQAISWMIEQSRNHNISAAVAFATLILENDYISLTALMRKIPKVQFDNLLRVMLYAIQDPYANYILPKVYSSQYKDLASLGTIYLNAVNASTSRPNLTHKANDVSKRAALEKELKRLIKAKGESEASLYFDNTTSALRELGYERFHVDGDTVYLDPHAVGQPITQPTPDAQAVGFDELMRMRRGWPAEARSYSAQAVIYPYTHVCELILDRESPQAKAYKNILGAFSSACEQVSMTTIREENGLFKFVSRITPLSEQVKRWIRDYDSQYDPPSITPPALPELLSLRTNEEYFRILFNPLATDTRMKLSDTIAPFPSFTRDSPTVVPPGTLTTPEPGVVPSSTIASSAVEAGTIAGNTAGPEDMENIGEATAAEPARQTDHLGEMMHVGSNASSIIIKGLYMITKTLLTRDPAPLTRDTFEALASQLPWAAWIGEHHDNDAKSLSWYMRSLFPIIAPRSPIHIVQDVVIELLSDMLDDVCDRLFYDWADNLRLLGKTVLEIVKHKSNMLRSHFAADSLTPLTLTGNALSRINIPPDEIVLRSDSPSLAADAEEHGLDMISSSIQQLRGMIFERYAQEMSGGYSVDFTTASLSDTSPPEANEPANNDTTPYEI